MTETVFANARVVLRREVVRASVLVRDGVIAGIDAGNSAAAGAVDLDGDYLLPGLVELHTDNLERNVALRPGVRWPMPAAVVAHDAQVAAAGITTVLDALALADAADGTLRSEMLQDAADQIADVQARGMLRAEHLLHLRCEVAFGGVLEMLEPLLDRPLVRLVSLMDHTPGQRQFVSLDKYREYYQGKLGYSDERMDELIRQRHDEQVAFADRHRRTIVDWCRTRGVPTASHDDATEAHVEEAAGYGVTISEFPTTVEAASAARRHGMATIMGAPNVVRGGSHSGNVSAAALAEAGLLDILSSDYAPNSLLSAAFLMHRDRAVPLADAVATVSATPAAAMGLDDRGEIAVGRRADLIVVHDAGHLQVVREAWRAGRRVV